MSSLKGNIGKVEAKVSKAGKDWTKLSLAVNKGSKEDPPIWYDVLCFGKLAGPAANLKKGARIIVKGELTEEKTFKKRDGTEGVDRAIKADEIECQDGTIISWQDGGGSSDELPF
jgi:single-stranded DNA-binding protein